MKTNLVATFFSQLQTKNIFAETEQASVGKQSKIDSL